MHIYSLYVQQLNNSLSTQLHSVPISFTSRWTKEKSIYMYTFAEELDSIHRFSLTICAVFDSSSESIVPEKVKLFMGAHGLVDICRQNFVNSMAG